MRDALVGVAASLALGIDGGGIEGKCLECIVVSKSRSEAEATISDTTKSAPLSRSRLENSVDQGSCLGIALSDYSSLVLVVDARSTALEHGDAFEDAFHYVSSIKSGDCYRHAIGAAEALVFGKACDGADLAGSQDGIHYIVFFAEDVIEDGRHGGMARKQKEIVDALLACLPDGKRIHLQGWSKTSIKVDDFFIGTLLSGDLECIHGRMHDAQIVAIHLGLEQVAISTRDA